VKALKNGEEKNRNLRWKTEEKKKMNWRGGRWNLYGSFTDRFTDRYKINYYFNLSRRWSVKNPSVIFEFRTKIFNDPPYFSWSVGNSVVKMTRSEMHLMHNPLEFAQSVGNFVGKIDPLITYRRTYSVGMDVGDCGISSNYFRTLCEMPTNLIRRYGRRWWWHFK
jgi:hypothetical protein